MLNSLKCRTRDFPPCRSDRCGLFIPDSNSGSSGSDASEGHGYCDERFHVSSVSHRSMRIQCARNAEVFL